MHFSQSLLAILPLAVLSSAAPAAEQSKKKGFTVKQAETGRYKLKSGPHQIAQTYRKYGKKVPDGISKYVASYQTGTVAANPQQYDKEYLCPVSVGTPAQSLNLDFDTGSADLWTFSTLQSASQRSGHAVYNPSSSSTSVLKSGYTWKITYGDGSGAGGKVYSDTVVIGGATVTSQAVEAATSVAAQFQQDTNNDGLVGLAFDSINTVKPTKVPTFFDNVKASLPTPVFASYLRHASAGEYDFGHIDSSKYTGSLTYVPVTTSQGFWEFTASGYKVGSSSYTLSLDSIADTGTSLIYLPTSVINNYWGTVSGAQYASDGQTVIFPCSASLPTLSIVIGGVAKTVPGSYMNYAPYSGSYCVGGLQDSSGIGFNILGDVFLKSQYVVFDAGSTRIGFGQAV